MERTDTLFSERARRVVRRVCACGTLLALLAGMGVGAREAHACNPVRGHRSYRRVYQRVVKVVYVYPAPRVQRPAYHPAASFDFYDLHVQATAEEGAASASALPQGKKFWIVVRARHWNALHRKIVINCTVASPSGERVHESDTVPMRYADGEAWAAIGPTTITLPDGVAVRSYTIHVSATLNGVTQTRTMHLPIFS